MYITVKEAAEYLSLPEDYIERLVTERKIKAVHDGTQFLLNKEQFNTHLEQLEKARRQLAEWYSEPLPEDPDVKDED